MVPVSPAHTRYENNIKGHVTGEVRSASTRNIPVRKVIYGTGPSYDILETCFPKKIASAHRLTLMPPSFDRHFERI